MLPPRFVAWLAMMSIIMGSFVLAADDPPKKEQGKKKPGFTISKETTYVTGPLREGGYIDYVAALNDRAREGVTPEDNAMVLLVKALGPSLGENVKVNEAIFQKMGCAIPPLKGKYFRQYNQFLKDIQLPALDDEKTWDMLERLTSRSWARNDFHDVAKWIEANQEALQWVESASLRTHFYFPILTTSQSNKYQGIFSILGGTDRIRELTRLQLCRAMLFASEGRFTDAKKDLLSCHRLARLVSQGVTVFDQLTGLSIETMASRAATAWLQQPGLPANLIMEYHRDLVRLPSMARYFDKVDCAERFLFLDTISLTSQHGIKHLERLAGGTGGGHELELADAQLFQNLSWDPAFKKANAWYDRMAVALKNIDRNERIRACEEIETEISQLRKTLRDELSSRIAESKESRVMAVYDMARCFLTPATLKVQIACDRVEQHQRHLQLAIALALYHREKGQYPEKLNELSPKYLPTIPLDLFSGKDVIFSRTAKGYRLYSVGPNGKDDGGVKDDEYPHKADDILLEMPLPEGKKK